MGQVIKLDGRGGMMISNDGDLCDVGLNVADYGTHYYVVIFVNGIRKWGYAIDSMSEFKESVRDKVKEF